MRSVTEAEVTGGIRSLKRTTAISPTFEMNTGGKTRSKKGKNKKINYNIQRGSCFTRALGHQKQRTSANLNCMWEGTAKPDARVGNPPANPLLRPAKTNLQKEN